LTATSQGGAVIGVLFIGLNAFQLAVVVPGSILMKPPAGGSGFDSSGRWSTVAECWGGRLCKPAVGHARGKRRRWAALCCTAGVHTR
jgi:hypothetical protein